MKQASYISSLCLGIVAQEKREFDEAKDYYLKALKIYEDAGDFYRAADVYHNLGVVAQEKREFEEAKAYYLKAMKIYEDAGDFYWAASDYHNLGIVAQEKREFEEAISCFVKAVMIFVDKEDFYKAGYPIRGLGRILKQIGESQFDTVWCEVTGFDCTGDLREVIWAVRDKIDSE